MDVSSIATEPVSNDTQAEYRAWPNFLLTSSLLMRMLDAREMENGKTRKKNLLRCMCVCVCVNSRSSPSTVVYGCSIAIIVIISIYLSITIIIVAILTM